ncbi:hypothetical protein FJZ31_34765 [Candidatus Poribacteria bacterium]|nr:hypothetical protein [Candidatus Poribacteria bacterium]
MARRQLPFNRFAVSEGFFGIPSGLAVLPEFYIDLLWSYVIITHHWYYITQKLEVDEKYANAKIR